ncbi:MAG: hypothetical protein AAFX99_17915, partial [Myxococcota bacterium]
MTTPDIQGRLVRLRQLLHGPGDPKAWESLKAVLRSWPSGSDRQVGIDYAQGLLDGWPDTVRLAEPEWVRQVLRGEPPPPIWPLVRTITTLAG